MEEIYVLTLYQDVLIILKDAKNGCTRFKPLGKLWPFTKPPNTDKLWPFAKSPTTANSFSQKGAHIKDANSFHSFLFSPFLLFAFFPLLFSLLFVPFLSTFCLSNTQLIKIILSSLLEYIYTTFEKYSNFAKCVIALLLSEVQSEDSNIRSSIEENQNGFNKTAHLLVLRYAGSKGEKLIRSMKNSLKCEIPINVTIRVTYSGAILYSKFTNIKNKTVKEHQNDIVYYVKCPED